MPFEPHRLPGDAVLAELKVNPTRGLSVAEVTERQRQYGKNEIPAPKGSSLLEMIIEQFKETLVLILLGAAVVSFILACFEEGDRVTAFVEPLVILVILAANATVGVIQETNAEKAIERLKESEAREATVLRQDASGNSQVLTIHASELVPGDIIHVEVGDKVPADCRILSISGASLQVEESALTGESEAVEKITEAIDKANAQNQDKKNMLFSGTLVVRGKATCVVTTTGPNTEIGKIARDLNQEEDKTPLQKKLDEFGEMLTKYIGAICVIVWLINIRHFTDPVHGSWLRGAIYYFKIAVALAVAAIPEGLPAVVTTCLALGTLKMAKKNAIVRSLPSVETLGCTTVICSDKTGTLTTNMMSVQKVLIVEQVAAQSAVFREFTVEGDSWAPEGRIYDSATKQVLEAPAAVSGALAELGKIASLCNEATLAYKVDEKTGAGQYVKTGAPTEAALKVLAEKIGIPEHCLHETLSSTAPAARATAASCYWESRYHKRITLEFDRARKSMSVVAESTGSKQPILFCKGAPESVLERCSEIYDSRGNVAPLTAEMRRELAARLHHYAEDGLRVLALAFKKDIDMKQDFRTLENFANIESNMTFVGLACMLDPPRPQVYDSIAKCRTAGIRVIVITGDNQTTAESICRRIGIFSEDQKDLRGLSYTGREFSEMSEKEQLEAVKRASLFSRVEPAHKLKLVTLLKSLGEVVAMTGDGVNDATALKKADIGVAMGSGTSVAREASDMVLQDDNFATIVMAVEEGRAIYANTKQFIRYLISSNIGEVACIFLTAALGIPEALIPVQLLWVNLVTDGLPATALGFNPPDKDIMKQPPRGRGEAIIDGWMFFRYLLIGTYVGVGTVGGFIWWFLFAERGPHITFSQLVNFHNCANDPAAFQGVDCSVFQSPIPSTVSLSILVVIEMLNALNALSENQSLLVVTPLSNPWVIAACTLSVLLHIAILYIPFLANIFHVAPLNQNEWLYVILLSLPVFFLDECLKFFSRRRQARMAQAARAAQKKAQ